MGQLPQPLRDQYVSKYTPVKMGLSTWLRLSGRGRWPGSAGRAARLQESQHAIGIVGERELALAGKTAHRQRHFALELFFDLDIPGLLQFGEMPRQVPLRESALPLQL